MKKKQFKKFVPLILFIFIILLVIIVFFLVGDKKLDLESNEVNKLYSYLGEVDIYRCGGLISYGEKAITKDDLSDNNTFCNSYYNLTENDIKILEVKSTKTGKNKICKVGDNTFIPDENSNNCMYTEITKKDLNKAYQKIYGEEISKYIDKFSISDSEVCYLKGEIYSCGNTGTYTYSIGTNATVYRIMDKAVKTYSDSKITISDYYLKISNNICYKNGSSEELEECSKEIKAGAKIDAELIKHYGSLYKHTFLNDSNNNFYWSKSEPIHQWN